MTTCDRGRATRRRRCSRGTRGSCSCAATTPFTPRRARRRRHVRSDRWRARSVTPRRGSGRPALRIAELSLTRSTPTGSTASRCHPPRIRPPHRRRAPGRRARGAQSATAIAFDAAGRRSSRVPLDVTSSMPPASTAPRRRSFISASSCALTATASGSSIAARPSRAMNAATSRQSGSPRHACVPSHRPSRRSLRSPARRSWRRRSVITPSSAHDQDQDRRDR